MFFSNITPILNGIREGYHFEEPGKDRFRETEMGMEWLSSMEQHHIPSVSLVFGVRVLGIMS